MKTKSINACQFDRRQFLQTAAGGLAFGTGSSLLFPNPVLGQRAEPHFFLHVCVSGGMDATYLFDARPLEFTDKGLQSNFLYKNDLSGAELLENPAPIVMTDGEGGSTLRSPLTDPLMAFKDDFTVVNGVLMSPSSNGHGGNMYYLFSNSSAPAASFMPIIGGTRMTPLEHVHFGGMEGDGNRAPTNFARSLQVRPGAGSGATGALFGQKLFPIDSPLMGHVKSRIAAMGAGPGMFASGARNMGNALGEAPNLSLALAQAGQNVGADGFSAALTSAVGYFLAGVTSSITIMLDNDPKIDVHSGSSAQRQLTYYRDIVENLAQLFATLKTTPVGVNGQNLLDVTTLVISTEFSRTMRQIGRPIGSTGTDHNQLTNSVILAGKGIAKGRILGASDMQTLNAGGGLDVSPAHLIKDPAKKSIMAKPFDFALGRPLDHFPETFIPGDYLGWPHVANTLMSLFNVEEANWFSVGGLRAPVIGQLIANNQGARR